MFKHSKACDEYKFFYSLRTNTQGSAGLFGSFLCHPLVTDGQSFRELRIGAAMELVGVWVAGS